ncbi:MAG: acyl-CoA dehydrogenase family protein, partial [Tepidiformaceae bacterium]
MVDFAIPEETKAIREKVRTFVHDVVIPAEEQLAHRPPKDVIKDLQVQARAEGLWMPFLPEQWGGMGLGPLANAMVQIELAESRLGAIALNSQGPDDATILTLHAHGTDFQKEKFLKPLTNGDLRVCFSMTERAAGADATGMQTRAVRDGDNWILNGEKWFSSAASVADLAMIMAKTNPDAPRHQQFSTFLVELPNPGYQIVRNIPTMADVGGREGGGGHGEIIIKDLVVPHANLVGGEGNGFAMGQHRLGYGRLRHGMHNIGMAQRALDMATKRVIERSTFGRPLAERQGVQWML